MGKNPNTFQKRQREFDKKRKAEDKRKRRQAQKNAPVSQTPEPRLKMKRRKIQSRADDTLIRMDARGEDSYGHRRIARQHLGLSFRVQIDQIG